MEKWERMYVKYDSDPKNVFMDILLRPFLQPEGRRIIMVDDNKDYQTLKRYPEIPRKNKSFVFVKRFVHDLKDFKEHVKLASGDFEDSSDSNLACFASDFRDAWYKQLGFWRPDNTWNFKLYSYRGLTCIDKNFSKRQLVDDIIPNILPELIKQKDIIKFLFFDPFEMHLTPDIC